jgi:hypothetical protein
MKSKSFETNLDFPKFACDTTSPALGMGALLARLIRISDGVYSGDFVHRVG